MEKVDIRTIAAKSGVSVSTVSKALKDSWEISAATKAKVVAIANELNYQPNPFASGLRRSKTNTIAVIIPEIANNYFTLAIGGIEEAARKKGYHVLIYLTHDDHEKEVAIIKHLENGRVDGMLISVAAGTKDFSHIDNTMEAGIAVVFFDRVNQQAETTKITTDDYESAFKGTEHLLEQGCRKIAFLAGSRNLSIIAQRQKGYEDALNKHGYLINQELIIDCTDGSCEAELAGLIKKRKIDGVFASVVCDTDLHNRCGIRD